MWGEGLAVLERWLPYVCTAVDNEVEAHASLSSRFMECR